MVFLLIALLLCFVLALFHPYSSRLSATGLWLGKAIVPPDAAGLYSRGLQDAITDGSVSRITFTISVLPYLVCCIAFVYAWWGPILTFGFYIVAIAIARRTNIASHQIDHYVNVIHGEMEKRRIKYEQKGDAERSEIIAGLSQQVNVILGTYFNSAVPVPSFRDARRAPYGDIYHLLDQFEEREQG